MIASSFPPSRFRGGQPIDQPLPSSLANRAVTSILQLLTKSTCLHPIHTICVIAVLTSTTYVGLFRETLFHATHSVGKTEWDSLIIGSRSLIAGPETGWKWQSFNTDAKVPGKSDHLALVTLVFPESSAEAHQTALSPFVALS